MKMLKEIMLPIAVTLVAVVNIIQNSQIKQLEQRLDEQRQGLIDRDKALQKELQDLKRYIETGEGNGG